jgi:hypothetical protein
MRMLRISLALWLVAGACAKRPTVAESPAHTGHWVVPFELYRDLPVIEVTDMRGERHAFVLDTGASFTVIDTRVAEAFGAVPYRDRAGETFERDVLSARGDAVDIGALHVLPRLKIGPVENEGEVGAFVTDLEMARRLQGRNIMGIIGYQSLQVPFTLDYPRSQLIVHARRPRMLDEGVPLLETDSLYHPVVPVVLDGRPVPMLLDSGSGACMQLPVELAEGVASGERAVTGYSLTVAGVMEDRATRLDGSIGLGAHAVDAPVADLGGDAPHIGGRMLRHFRVTFDPKKERVWFEPGDSRPRCGPIRSVGFYLLRSEAGDAWEVALLLPGAESMGVEVGDRVLEMAGTSLASLDSAGIQALWSAADEVEVVLERQGETKRLVVPVRTLVP